MRDLSALERLEVPALFDDATGDLVFGAALAAVSVESADGIRARATLFRPVLKAVSGVVVRPRGFCRYCQAQCATALRSATPHFCCWKGRARAISKYCSGRLRFIRAR